MSTPNPALDKLVKNLAQSISAATGYKENMEQLEAAVRDNLKEFADFAEKMRKEAIKRRSKLTDESLEIAEREDPSY